MSGFPKFEGSQVLPEFPYAEYAESLDLAGIRLDNPRDIGRVWDEALAERRPVVIDAVTDPEVPTLPPHLSLDQAMGYLKTLFKGDPNAKGMITQAYRQMLDGWMPKHRLSKHLSHEQDLDIQQKKPGSAKKEDPEHYHV